MSIIFFVFFVFPFYPPPKSKRPDDLLGRRFFGPLKSSRLRQRRAQGRHNRHPPIIISAVPSICLQRPARKNMELTKKAWRIMFDLSPVRMGERRNWISRRKAPAPAVARRGAWVRKKNVIERGLAEARKEKKGGEDGHP
jgi:hypothetical protein